MIFDFAGFIIGIKDFDFTVNPIFYLNSILLI